MTLNTNLILIFKNVIKDKNKSVKIINYIQKLESKGQISNKLALSLLKSIIIIGSYFPKEQKFIYKYIKFFYKLPIDSKKDFLKNLSNLENNFNIELDDTIIDKLIFKTFELIHLSYKMKKDLSVSILNEILISTNKIKINNILKVKILLLLVEKSINIIENNNKTSFIFIKITELCGLTPKLINNFIMR